MKPSASAVADASPGASSVMKLRQPSGERDKEFFVMVQTLFNQETYIVGSNLFNYYDRIQLDDLNKCEKFRNRTARMNVEGQSCFLDLIDTEQNQLAGCIGCVKVNRIDREASLAVIFYQQYFDYIGESVRCFFGIIRAPKYNLHSLLCNASGYFLGEDAVEVLLQVGFVNVTDEKPRMEENPLWLRYVDPDAPKRLPPHVRSSASTGKMMGPHLEAIFLTYISIFIFDTYKRRLGRRGGAEHVEPGGSGLHPRGVPLLDQRPVPLWSGLPLPAHSCRRLVFSGFHHAAGHALIAALFPAVLRLHRADSIHTWRSPYAGVHVPAHGVSGPDDCRRHGHSDSRGGAVLCSCRAAAAVSGAREARNGACWCTVRILRNAW